MVVHGVVIIETTAGVAAKTVVIAVIALGVSVVIAPGSGSSGSYLLSLSLPPGGE